MSKISSAEEFVRLRSSQEPEEYHLAAWAEATNAKTPQEILVFLIDDPWENVREKARQRLDKIDSKK